MFLKMSDNQTQQSWQEYRQQELTGVTLILQKLGFELATNQPHIAGERYLSSVKKLVLLGKRLKDNKPVIIKVSSDTQGAKEIIRERDSRQTLTKIDFAYHVFLSPEEILFITEDNYIIFITAFIDQELTFLQRSLQEQFFLALKAFELQEGAQAVTRGHNKLIKQTFGSWQAKDYLKKLDQYIDETDNELLIQAREFFAKHQDVVNLYSSFLTHWDFVPHNFRIKDNDIYLLDHSSLRFGNKYESWARFINFMTLYNPELEKLLIDYVAQNRSKQEFLSLKLMRVFRLAELIWHYAKTLSIATDDLQTLNRTRVNLWSEALKMVLEDKSLDKNIILEYQKTRDSLRDEDEKKRQAELH